MDWLTSAAALAALRPTAVVAERACTRRHASGCTLCAEACPKAALLPAEHSMRVDTDACIGCGLCVTACPVDAIGGVGQLQPAIAQHLERGDAVRCDVARLLSPEDEGTHTDVPCIAAIDVETLAAGALAAGRVAVVRGPCATCPLGTTERVQGVLVGARDIIGATGATAEITEREVQPAPEPKRRWGRRAAPKRAHAPMSRRSLFGLRATEDEARPEATALALLARDATSRQCLLASHDQPALPHLTVDEACTACGGCVAICPTNALHLDDGALSLSPVDCVACDECVRICPEGAIHPGNRQPGGGQRLLARVSIGRCSRCERRLGPGEIGQCHACTSRQSLVSGIWDLLEERPAP